MVLYTFVLYDLEWSFKVLYSVVLISCMVLYCIVKPHMVLHGLVWSCIFFFGLVWSFIVLYGIEWYGWYFMVF